MSVLSPFINIGAGLRTQIRDPQWHGGAWDKLRVPRMLARSTALQAQLVYAEPGAARTSISSSPSLHLGLLAL